ncbi:MAG: ribonuclease P protein component [Gordonia sp. (in: high G+C Gram-positive bacteria)]
MSADSSRISRSSDFARTLDKGVRVSVRDMAVHILPVGSSWPDDDGARRDVALVGGPWLGLIVSKKVGDAVTRHRLARRLRHAFAQVKAEIPEAETFVVLRAYPSVADRSSTELVALLRRALRHRRVVERFGDAASHPAVTS